MSNLTVGLSPISKEFVEAEATKQKEETGEDDDIIKAKVIREAVKEFMIIEMKVKVEHFEKLNIVRTFTPQKPDWQTIYVELESQNQVDWLMSHTRWIPETEKGQVQTKVVKHVPRQLYNSTCVCGSTEPRRSLNCTISQQILEMALCVIK